jgi:nucleotide-binding universal stress UspA family protein
VPFIDDHRVGDPGPTIADAAQQDACDLIVMGTRGMGSHAGALLGSVAQGAVSEAQIPILLVK